MKLIFHIKQRIEDLYYALSIKNKISLAFIIVFSSLLILLVAIVYNITSGILINKAIDSTLQNLRLVSEKFDIAFENVENYAKAAIINNDVQEVLFKTQTGNELDDYSSVQKVRKTLDSIINPRFLIDSMILYDFKGKVYDSGKIQGLEYAFRPEYNRFNGDFVTSGPKFWTDTHESNFTEAESRQKIITFTSAVINANSGQPLGVLETNVNEKYVSGLYSKIEMGESGRLFIVNKDGMVVSDTKKNNIYSNISAEPYYKWVLNNEGGKIFKTNNNQNLIISRHYKRLDWIIIGIVPTWEITQDKYFLISRIAVIGLVFILTSIMLTIFISNSITKPIVKLKKSMEYVGEGDLEVSVEVKTKDEVGALAEEFNRMIRKTSVLMESVYTEQKRKKEYELALLQSQINPHFLYNTLESICGLAVLNRNEDIINLTNELAMFYRGVLSKGSRIVTIEDEIKITERYMRILKVRYGDQFDYDINVESEIYKFSTIKLVLQPIVENSINHGLRNKRGKGFLEIKGLVEKGNVSIYVIDNGVGMRPEQLERIFMENTGDNLKKSFGLKSTDERIKLYFGNEYGLIVKSVFNEGTTVKIVLPAKEMWGGLE
ncbi:MAG TPA: sensor histidine kinase [Ruminiclostridium sp.]